MRAVHCLVVSACVACTVSSPQPSSLPAQVEVTDAQTVTITSVAAWAGEPITIHDESVDWQPGAGGVRVVIDGAATHVVAVATFTARADVGHEDDGRESLADAKGAFAVNDFAVTCGHGQTHGTSLSASSGCKTLTVTVPPGSADMPLDVEVTDVNGGVSIVGVPVAKRLVVTEGGTGVLDVKVDPQKASTIELRAGFDVTLGLPSTFAADSVTIHGDSSKLDTSAFPGLQDGSSYGKTGVGAAQLTIASGVGAIKVLKL